MGDKARRRLRKDDEMGNKRKIGERKRKEIEKGG